MRIENTPIVLDNFSTRPLPGQSFLYLLSHLHADHTVGLTQSWDGGQILCSDTTRELLLLKFKPKRRELIRALPVGETTLVYLDAQRTIPVSVTLVNANHCPGSVMFLLDGYFGRVLCTGDFRYDPLCPEVHFPLFDKLRDGPPVTLALVDNTYCEPHNLFESRASTSDWLLQTLRAYPVDTKFYIGIDTLGKEELLVKLAMGLNTRIVVSPKRFAALSCLALSVLFTCEPHGGRVEVTSRRLISVKHGRVRWGPCGVGVLASAFYVPPTSRHGGAGSSSSSSNAAIGAWGGFEDDHRQVSTGAMSTERQWCMYPLNSDDAVQLLVNRATHGRASGAELPRLLHVPYSLHSSYSELKSFIRRVRPEKVVPSSIRNATGRRALDAIVGNVLGRAPASLIAARGDSNSSSLSIEQGLVVSLASNVVVPQALGWQGKKSKRKTNSRRPSATSSSSTYANSENARAIAAGVGVREDCFNKHPAVARRTVRRSRYHKQLGALLLATRTRAVATAAAPSRITPSVSSVGRRAAPVTAAAVQAPLPGRRPLQHDRASMGDQTRNASRVTNSQPTYRRLACAGGSSRGDYIARLTAHSNEVSSRRRKEVQTRDATAKASVADTGGSNDVVHVDENATASANLPLNFSRTDDKIVKVWSRLKRKMAYANGENEQEHVAGVLVKRVATLRALLGEYSDRQVEQRIAELRNGHRRATATATAMLDSVV